MNILQSCTPTLHQHCVAWVTIYAGHSCCTLAIEKYQIYKLISHRVARYELVGLIFIFIFLWISCGFFVELKKKKKIKKTTKNTKKSTKESAKESTK